MNERFRPYAAALVFFMRDDEVLLARRYNTGWADGTYSVPSGHIEDQEDVIEAAIRESKEEVGVEVQRNDIRIAHVSYRRNTDRIYVDFFLVCEKWEGELRNCEPDKCDDIRWFKRDVLPDNTTPFIVSALDKVRSDEPFSQIGW